MRYAHRPRLQPPKKSKPRLQYKITPNAVPFAESYMPKQSNDLPSSPMAVPASPSALV